ncbi:MAG: MMPL family transporter [Solirubrobacteraceae bacterium]
MRSAARTSARHPKTAIAGWLILIVACLVVGSMSGTRTLSNAASGTGESARADARLTAAGLADPPTENVLLQSSRPAETASAAHALAERARRLPTVSSVLTPSTAPALSRTGGRTEMVIVSLRANQNNDASRVVGLEAVVASVASEHPGVTIQEAGGGSIDRATTQLVDNGLHRAELISLPVTLLILVLVFGALVAASVPLLLGLTSVAAALGAQGLISHLVPSGNSTAPVVVLIGLAVGIDYSLFYIRRERAERRLGAGPEAALDATSATVGRAIVVAGLTVAIGLAGLLFTGFGVFTSMALGAITVVGFAVVGSLTVLPAVLTMLGERIDRGRLGRRSSRRARRPAGSARWHRVATVITGHPRVALATSVLLLAGLAVPALGMKTANPGDTDVPARTPVLVAEHAIERAFPGSSDTAELVVTGHNLQTPASLGSLRALGSRGMALTHGRGEVSVRVGGKHDVALVEIPIPQVSLSSEHRDVDGLRQILKPATARLIPGARAQLTGGDAENVDFTQQLTDVTPLVVGFVLALAFGLLLASFRSARLALSVMALNLLSVGAAFGVLVAVFQHRWAQSLLGFTSNGAVTNWLPLFAFVVLFGLSMDYTVLVLERAREARRAGASAREAATEALSATGGTVTSAAVVMIAVFSIFATLQLLEFKQLGIGLAAAIALDATVVRGVALPAMLTLLGDRGLPAPRVVDRRSEGWEHASRVARLGSIGD